MKRKGYWDTRMKFGKLGNSEKTPKRLDSDHRKYHSTGPVFRLWNIVHLLTTKCMFSRFETQI